MSSLRPILYLAAVAGALVLAPSSSLLRAQGKAVNAKSLRCIFSLNATGTWNKDDAAGAVINTSKLVLRFDSINTDEGTAELKSGSVGSGLTLQSAGGNLHFLQSFRSGSMHLTTVFDKETTGGKLKAVHSRHEYLNVPLDGSTSRPEQYYGVCEILN
jgi:hypothetical protein